MPSSLSLSLDQVRTIRLASQGFGQALVAGPIAAVPQRSGYVRTLGGCDAYLALRARQRTMRRVELDHAVERGELQIVPAVRGCIYLVPRADVPLCLSFAEQLSHARTQRELQKAGVAAGEVEELAELVLATLRKGGPLTPDGLRRTLPAGAIRSLGDRGKKVGISSPLPAALRWLEFAGRIQRTPEGGRVDTERYQWRVTDKSPFADSDLPEDPTELHALLLERYVRHAGVAALPEFCAWSGLSQREARAAAAAADLVAATIAETAADVWTTADAEHLARQRDAVHASAAFLPFEDNATHLYGGPGYLVDADHAAIEVPNWGQSTTTPLGSAPHLALRAILADGCLAGFWEYDPDARLAVPRCFKKPSRTAQRLIEDLSAAVTAFLRDEVGHGHSFALDTDDELRKRLALLRTIGGERVAAKTKPAAARPAAKAPRRPPARTAARPAAKQRPARKGTARKQATRKQAERKRGAAKAPAQPRTIKLPRPGKK